jgi:hypothetical protein
MVPEGDETVNLLDEAGLRLQPGGATVHVVPDSFPLLIKNSRASAEVTS